MYKDVLGYTGAKQQRRFYMQFLRQPMPREKLGGQLQRNAYLCMFATRSIKCSKRVMIRLARGSGISRGGSGGGSNGGRRGTGSAAGSSAVGGRATGTAGTAARVGVGDTTLSVERSSGGDGLGLGGVDTEGHPGEEAVSDAVAEKSVLHDGVDAIGGSLLAQDRVVGVGGKLLGVGVVGGEGLDGRDKVLVEEGLADVGGGDNVAEGVVGVESSILVDHQVDVGGAGGVVAGEDGLELGDTVGVGLLDTAEPGLVDVGLVGGVTVAGGDDAGVDTGGVAVPHLEVDVGDGLASVNVDDLVVKDDVDTLLLLDDVAADILARDVCKGSLVNGHMRNKPQGR